MAVLYTTFADEALDLICMRHYGVQAGAVEQVLEANPAIRDVAHDLPIGTEITLPDLDTSELSGQTTSLWD